MTFSADNAILRTERLELRPQAADDAQAIFEAFASDERVTKYMDWRPAPRLDVLKTRDRYADLAADMAHGKRIAWVIRKLDEERLCGKIELRIDGTDGASAMSWASLIGVKALFRKQ